MRKLLFIGLLSITSSVFAEVKTSSDTTDSEIVKAEQVINKSLRLPIHEASPALLRQIDQAKKLLKKMNKFSVERDSKKCCKKDSGLGENVSYCTHTENTNRSCWPSFISTACSSISDMCQLGD